MFSYDVFEEDNLLFCIFLTLGLLCTVSLLSYANWMHPQSASTPFTESSFFSVTAFGHQGSDTTERPSPRQLLILDQNSCTQMGCQDGVNISFGRLNARQLSGTFSIDGGESITVDCAQRSTNEAYSCLPYGIKLHQKEGKKVHYKFDISGELYEGDLVLDIKEYRPNGKECAPVCYQDRHVIQMKDTL